MKIGELKNKKILILGFGQEGKDTFKFLRKLFPGKTIGIADKNQSLEIKNLRLSKKHLGKNYLKSLKNYDVIFRSPGIHLKILEPFLTKKQAVTSQTELFFENCPGIVVGVTGTKGKGITASLIHKILKENGFSSYLVGNIGKPALGFLLSAKPDNVYVYELSSHQLINLKKSPKIAVFLNIFPDHLDYFKDFKEYVATKSNIVLYQTKNDCLVYNHQNKIVRKIAEKSKAQKIPIKSQFKTLHDLGIKKPPLSLPGKHNLLNITAAVKTAEIFKVSKKNTIKAIKNFKTPAHRLEHVGKFQGISFYNDSASTIPESTIAAIDALEGKVKTIILGGSDKGADFKSLAKKIIKSKIKTLILFPETGQTIWENIKKTNSKQKKMPVGFFANNMKQAVELSYQYTQKNEICLLSCASASFSVFKNYKERGKLFKKYVKKLGQRIKK